MSSGAKRVASSRASRGWHSARDVILGDDEQNVYPCKILDASNSGYRIGLKPMPKLEVGSEIILEHTDKTRQRVCVCWVAAHEVGLKLMISRGS